MRTLRNNPGFLVNFPSILNEVLATEFPQSNSNRTAKPLVNILENDTDFTIEVLAPGFNKEDFTIKVEADNLIISAELNNENNTSEDKKYSLREFYKLAFSRSFTLPKDKVVEDEIKASYTNGILVVSVPKREEAKPKAPKTIAVM